MGRKRNKIRKMLRNGTNLTPKELASCYGKIKYDSYAEAKAAADRSIDAVKPYKCKFGDKVHYHKGKRYNSMSRQYA